MKNNKLGCFTGSGIFAILITMFLLVGIALASGSQMFSAGSLNAEPGQVYGSVNSHAQIEECSVCHAAPWSTDSMADRCVACHTDVAAEMSDITKLHGAIFQNGENFACRDCHPEHRGADSLLTDTSGVLFPHDALGYSMNGHQGKEDGNEFTCVDCHPDDLSTFTTKTCLNCHDQIDLAYTQSHFLSFGPDCLACHDGVDIFGNDFNHSIFLFNLAGKHEGVTCTKCHLDARTLLDLKSTPQECASCHSDEHDGRFGKDCAGCHAVEGWKPAKFDHALADFKLDGRHGSVDCQNCHADRPYRGTPKDCYSCHQAVDEHEGRYGFDCAICHNTNDWDAVNVDHNIFAFKLDGKHVEVKCEDCHINGQFKGTPVDCYSCHKGIDAHKGTYGTDCALCHNTADWKDVRFDHSKFPLTERHSGLACDRCHSSGVYVGLSAACVSCHGDPAYHAGLFGTNCASCHSTRNWSAGYNGPHPGIADEGGSGVNHGGASCKECHTSTLHSATCGSCHDGNEGGEGGEGGDD